MIKPTRIKDEKCRRWVASLPCIRCGFMDALENQNWIDARKTLPPLNELPKRYLVILDTKSPAQHCKDWAGRGEPEIAEFFSQWTPYPWMARGSLSVAYWMHLPEFSKRWDKTVDGQPGRWLDA